MTPELEEKLAGLPEQPGVYIMRDVGGNIIYVGKAIILKNRVRSYFQAGQSHPPKVRLMVSRIHDLEYIVTASEMEALILECNLIKKHRPKYNISLRDDKSYPYIRVTLQEAYPRVHITRRVIRDGAKYFGPYTSAGAVHETLKLVKNLFPLRTCRRLDAKRPCLQYHIHRCLAPCAGLVGQEQYMGMIQDVCLLLEGRGDALIRQLKDKMAAAAENLEFEHAAELRDQLAAVEMLTEKQNMVSEGGDMDVLGVARAAPGVCMQVFFVRSGKLVGRDHFLLKGVNPEESEEEVLAAFMKQYYDAATFIPREIVVPISFEEQDLLSLWLTNKKGKKVGIHVPQRGAKRDLLRMAEANAQHVLEVQSAELARRSQQTEGAVAELAEHLGLPEPPERIECFDISHIQGAETVASMVVFQGGAPKREAYRRFKLQTVEGKPDDFKSMEEVVGRRYRNQKDAMPDLIIIDGGKGQLNAALPVIRAAGLARATVVGLAKEFEYIFTEGEKAPLILPPRSQALYLVQRIRDEAHRFAITYHRKLRARRNMVSVLDHIPGIGAKRRQELWTHFGSLQKMKDASVDELAGVKGMTQPAAQAVWSFFRREKEATR